MLYFLSPFLVILADFFKKLVPFFYQIFCKYHRGLLSERGRELSCCWKNVFLRNFHIFAKTSSAKIKQLLIFKKITHFDKFQIICCFQGWVIAKNHFSKVSLSSCRHEQGIFYKVRACFQFFRKKGKIFQNLGKTVKNLKYFEKGQPHVCKKSHDLDTKITNPSIIPLSVNLIYFFDKYLVN